MMEQSYSTWQKLMERAKRENWGMLPSPPDERDWPLSRIVAPVTLPTDTGQGCAFDLTGTYLAVAHSNSPYITIYDAFSRTVFKTGNSLLDIQAGDVTAVGYAKEDGFTGETKEIVRMWRWEG